MLNPCSMKILLLTPPMTQLNTPYPATAYLKGFLASRGYIVEQADPALELVLRLFSKESLVKVAKVLHQRAMKEGVPSRSVEFFLHHQISYINSVEPVVRYLQGKDPSLALRIVKRDFLPEGPRFASLDPEQSSEESDGGDPLQWAFGAFGIQDRAKYLASLFIDDLADVISTGIDPHFGLSRYAEKLAASVPSFSLIQTALESEPSLVEQILDGITEDLLEKHQPTVVALTVPFPGNVYGAFRMARKIKALRPEIQILLGGGYANTELRGLSDPRVFDYVDFVTLDDGEKPFLCVLEYLEKKSHKFLRTFVREKGQVVYQNDSSLHDIPHRDTGTPSYEGLPMDRYLSLFEMLNPVHRIWSDGRWNKMTLAHGCYWKKCSFCDISLDYIGRYDPASADVLIQRMEALMAETGQSGFHFVDEAAPPAVLRALAEKIIQRGLCVTWWGNIRFDKAFTPELAELLARSGCVAVTGGLEVASDRLLKLMQKGVTVEQVARVAQSLSQAGIMVHAYLMYGFPSQTEQETIDALERVRQLFEEGCLQSAYWHRFSVTAHSPIGMNPEKYGIRLLPEGKTDFARNDLAFEDPTGCDHDRLGEGLRKALYNYMLGAGLDMDVRFWFGMKGSKFRVAKPQVPKDLIRKALSPLKKAQ